MAELILEADECGGGAVAVIRDGVEYALKEMRCGGEGAPRFVYVLPRLYRVPTVPGRKSRIVPRGKRVFAALEGTCAYCRVALEGDGATRATADHVMPRWAGHLNRFNLVPACFACNQAKAGRTPRQWYDDLLKTAPLAPQVLGIPELIRVYGRDLLPEAVAEWAEWHPVTRS